MPKDTTFEIRAGHGQQLGANYDGKGVNFAPVFRPCGAGGAVFV